MSAVRQTQAAKQIPIEAQLTRILSGFSAGWITADEAYEELTAAQLWPETGVLLQSVADGRQIGAVRQALKVSAAAFATPLIRHLYWAESEGLIDYDTFTFLSGLFPAEAIKACLRAMEGEAV